MFLESDLNLTWSKWRVSSVGTQTGGKTSAKACRQGACLPCSRNTQEKSSRRGQSGDGLGWESMEGLEQGRVTDLCVGQNFLKGVGWWRSHTTTWHGVSGTSILETPFGHLLSGLTTVCPTIQRVEPGTLYWLPFPPCPSPLLLTTLLCPQGHFTLHHPENFSSP